MDVKEIKNLIKHSTSVLVLDNGEPSFVVLGYNTYKDLVAANKGEEKEIKINPVRNNSAEVQVDRARFGGTSSGISSPSNGLASGYNSHERETEVLEQLNKEILALKSQIEAEEKGQTNPHSVNID